MEITNDYKTVRTVKELEDYIGNADVIGFDFETAPTEKYRTEPLAALDPHKAEIVGVSVSVAEGTGRYAPLRHRCGRNGDVRAIEDFIRTRIYLRRDAVKVAHNLAFETQFVYKSGAIIQPPYYDTIAAAQLTLKSETEFRDLTDSGLKTLVPYIYGEELPKFEEVTGGKFFDELDPDDEGIRRYACADSDYALRLYHTFNGWFQKYMPLHETLIREVESPAAVYSGLMRYNGVGVDIALMELKKAEAEGLPLSLAM